MRNEFLDKGFLHISNLLSEEEVNYFTDLIMSYKNIGVHKTDESFIIEDGITTQENFWSLIYNEKILSILKNIFGDNPKYIRHSEITCDSAIEGKYQGFLYLTGWHRDHRYRGEMLKIHGEKVFDESQYPFKIAKIGIYLNSHEENDSPTVFFPRSHRAEYSCSFFESKLFSFFKKIISYPLRSKSFISFPYVRSRSRISLPVEPIEFKPQRGDAVIFDPRIIHAGTPRSGPRKILWFDYGVENPYTYDYCKYWEQERKDMGYGRIEFPDKLKKILIQKKLFLNGLETYSSNSLIPESGVDKKFSFFEKLKNIFN